MGCMLNLLACILTQRAFKTVHGIPLDWQARPAIMEWGETE